MKGFAHTALAEPAYQIARAESTLSFSLGRHPPATTGPETGKPNPTACALGTWHVSPKFPVLYVSEVEILKPVPQEQGLAS